ncbi:MAG: 1-deoxy-D-xylulose-5-phosphate reductoisomerase [Proteobacteria bacterium]|nr:1-deoxy-D-xylulose-5-phosphate reductoisomerase [Pseudomonadota bacterium]
MNVISEPLAPKTVRMPRSVTILGSTGSVGCNTVELIENNPGDYVVEALTANRNVHLLVEQSLRLKPNTAVVADPDCYQALKQALAGTGIEAAAGPDALIEAAARPADWVMASIVGAAGLKPTLTAVRRGATIGLANKECLVSAGDMFMNEVVTHGATLLPVDSEHSAIFQVFDFDNADRVHRIILTASGGPFRESSLEQMAKMTPEQAVAHPNWDMGAKISVDSATMMNKGLELIEAFHLFPVSGDQIEILVHPQSVIHSMVDYVDGSVLAQLGTPDMRTPIAYALAWPKRMAAHAPRLDLEKIATLTFEAPDMERFPALRLARQALNTGAAAPTVMNAANEVAVRHFLDKNIGFLDIVRIVEETLIAAPGGRLDNLDDVSDADTNARRIAEDLVLRLPKDY